MKKYILILSVVALMLIIVVLMLNRDPVQGTDNQEVNHGQNAEGIAYLSIEQSLLPAIRLRCFDRAYGFPFYRINPAIKEYLLVYLENNRSNGKFTNHSLRLLGYVAGEKEIPFIDSFIQSSIKKINSKNSESGPTMGFEKIAMGSGGLIGIMVKKEIKGARELLNKYSNVSAWTEESNGDVAQKEAIRGHGIFLMQTYQYSMDGDVLRALKKGRSEGREDLSGYLGFLEKLEVDAYTELIQPIGISEKDLQKKLKKDLQEYSGLIKPILYKMTYEQWRQKVEQDKAKDAKVKAELSKKTTISDMNDDPLVRLAIVEAQAAYDKVSKLILVGNFEGISKLLADNGKPISAKKAKRDREGMFKALEKERQILEAVNRAGLNNLNDIQVEVTLENHQDSPGITIMEAKFDAFPLDLKSSEVEGKSKITEAVVTFVIRDSAEIYKSVIPNASNATKAKNGDLKVLMIQSNGKWLWNPFGW